MKTHEMRDLPAAELQAAIQDTRREVVSLRFQLAARKLESPAKLRNARKQLSRLLTIQTESASKSAGEQGAKGQPKKAQAAKAAPAKAATKTKEAAGAKTK